MAGTSCCCCCCRPGEEPLGVHHIRGHGAHGDLQIYDNIRTLQDDASARTSQQTRRFSQNKVDKPDDMHVHHREAVTGGAPWLTLRRFFGALPCSSVPLLRLAFKGWRTSVSGFAASSLGLASFPLAGSMGGYSFRARSGLAGDVIGLKSSNWHRISLA